MAGGVLRDLEPGQFDDDGSAATVAHQASAPAVVECLVTAPAHRRRAPPGHPDSRERAGSQSNTVHKIRCCI